MFQKTTLMLLLLAIVSCKEADSNEKEKIKAANWLLGNWEKMFRKTGNYQKIGKNKRKYFQGSVFFYKRQRHFTFRIINIATKRRRIVLFCHCKRAK